MTECTPLDHIPETGVATVADVAPDLSEGQSNQQNKASLWWMSISNAPELMYAV